MASSLSFPILIPFAMESPSCVTVPHMAFSKPPKHHRPLVRGRVRVRPLNRHLNSATLFRCSAAADDAVITLHVGGMMCEGCANSVKKLLESRPQVLSARVNLASEIAIVSPAPEEKPAPNYLKQLGEELAQHLTTCGFTSTLQGLLARQRRNELQRVNEQLIQINAALRKQAKIESYAPSLSYAPIGGGRIPDNEIIVDPKKQELISKLKNGKNFLRNQQLDKAFIEFKNALELAQNLKDPIEEKKAARGLGASLQRQGKYRDAIKYHSMVLSISEREGEDSGNTEAFGAIADCYTELGELEKAGQFYDKYIARLEKD